MQCGHLFACAECAAGLKVCSICREPIYASYDIRRTASKAVGRESASETGKGSNSSKETGTGRGASGADASVHPPTQPLSGYISSGSESYTDIAQKPCRGCCKPGALIFKCACQDPAIRLVVCIACSALWKCPFCKRASISSDFEEVSIPSSSPSSGTSEPAQLNVDQTGAYTGLRKSHTDSKDVPNEGSRGEGENLQERAISMLRGGRSPDKSLTTSLYDKASPKSDGASDSTKLEGVDSSSTKELVKHLSEKSYFDSVVEVWGNTSKSVIVTAPVRFLAERCARENSIIELPKSCEELNRMHLAAEVGRLGLTETNCGRKAVIIAPTVLHVRQYLEVVKQVTPYRANCILGNATVDAWEHEEWREALESIDFLITTPQLFLDSLDARYVQLGCFCVLIVDECQHCTGSHPFARIFKDHYSKLRQNGKIRVLGLSERLLKSKMKGTASEKQQVVKEFEALMDSKVIENSLVMEAISITSGTRVSESDTAGRGERCFFCICPATEYCCCPACAGPETSQRYMACQQCLHQSVCRLCLGPLARIRIGAQNVESAIAKDMSTAVSTAQWSRETKSNKVIELILHPMIRTCLYICRDIQINTEGSPSKIYMACTKTDFQNVKKEKRESAEKQKRISRKAERERERERDHII